MEYKPTTLPQYWPIKSRSEFSSATVQSGHVLLFSQDGQSITAKLSDGSYAVIGGSCSQCPSVQNVQFYKCASVSAGQTVQAVRVSGISSPQDLNTIFYAIPGLNRHFQSENGRYFFEYMQDQNQGLYRWFLYDTQTQELCAQAFWMQPSNYQSPAQVPEGEWNFFVSAPSPSIVDVSAAGTLYYQVSGAYPDSWNGRYLQTDISQEGRLVYQHSNAQTPRYLFWTNGMCCIGSAYSNIQDLYSDTTFYLDNGWRATDPQTTTAPSSVILTLQSGGSAGWTGYKAVQSSGTYTFQSSITSGLSYGTSIPAVGNVYNDGATVQALMLGSGGWQITDATATAADIISGKKAYISGGIVTGTYAGIDVGSTTAQASDVLSGKIFYTSGGIMSSGTIPSVSLYSSGNTVSVASGYISAAQTIQVGSALQSATFVPTTSDQVISSGAYLAGQQVIQGDSNLVASNIVSGVSIFGVSGTAAITYQPAQYTINGASDQSINGTYIQQSTFNNRPVYELNQ